MIRPKLILIACCAAVFGSMVFNSTAAQAETGAKWLLAEAWPNSGSIPFLEEWLSLMSKTNLILHSKIAGVAVLYECVWAETENVRLLANGSIGGINGLPKEAKVRFFNCSTYLNGSLSPACVPIDKTGSGVIHSTYIHGLLELHQLAGGVKDDVVRILPDVGETFAIIEMGEECSIGEKVPLIGKLTIKDSEGFSLTNLEKHVVEVGPLTELWTISKTAEHVATLLGSAWAYLTFFSMKFSGDPA